MPLVDATKLADSDARLLYEKHRLCRTTVVNELSRVLFSPVINDADKLEYAIAWLENYYSTLVK